MTTEDMIARIIELAYPAYKKNSKGCLEARKLDRKEPVEIDGYTFTCWYEYVCYKVCEYIKSKIPDAELELVLDGNDSTINVSLDDDEHRNLNMKMYALIKEWESTL